MGSDWEIRITSSTLPRCSYQHLTRYLPTYYPPRLTGCLRLYELPPELPRRPPRDAPDSSTDDAKPALLIQGGDEIAFLDNVLPYSVTAHHGFESHHLP
ncbi:uncharacterized protein LMH87_008753 [Akanthomyces muscarius]|uniref:Uncharacterized protein n=1 Tax=Akanthomyces muscarius TaxID=2231603 RepID=A0A9W8QHU2_AKAMU|nr:uncharacterized protein LMH87_008753 [Akanthomyces muscarius]KAJ4158218.1 hypothetical protein LMH87_008753 [Akanthomyces muscarius]